MIISQGQELTSAFAPSILSLLSFMSTDIYITDNAY